MLSFIPNVGDATFFFNKKIKQTENDTTQTSKCKHEKSGSKGCYNYYDIYMANWKNNETIEMYRSNPVNIYQIGEG